MMVPAQRISEEYRNGLCTRGEAVKWILSSLAEENVNESLREGIGDELQSVFWDFVLHYDPSWISMYGDRPDISKIEMARAWYRENR